MPVIDYKAMAETTRKRVINSPELSEKNREALKRFMNAYNVSYAREGIFLSNIIRLLKKTDDIEKDMHDRDKINRLFKEIKEEHTQGKRGLRIKQYSPATLETVKNVSLCFVRWLNGGDKPEGFKDLRGDKKAQKRNLEPKDMITWEDGLSLVQHTPSLQLKAALLTQLDCGFRPSEFIDLDYGDVEVKDDMVLFNVKGGKTGKRIVWMHRAVPQFLRWYDNHPEKKKDSPLWTLENTARSHRQMVHVKNVERYTFLSLQNRFKLLKEKAGLDKPIDFYNLRHSSCYLDKIDNVPNDLAAERHGHSVDFYVNTYGRLDLGDKLARVRSHYGSPEEKKQLLKNQRCTRCQAINEPSAEFCTVCGVPLSVEQAAKVYSERNKMSDKLSRIEEMLLVMAKADPRFKKAALLELEEAKKKK